MKNTTIQYRLQNFDFQKSKNDLPENFQFRLKKSKNLNIHLANYIPFAVERIKGGISPISKNEVPVKIKEKRYFVDTQNNIMDFNIIKNYHKVFINKERKIYSSEYIKNISNLLHKNEKNNITKRKQLYIDKEDKKDKSINSFYITSNPKHYPTNKKHIVEYYKSFHEEDKYTLNETYDSNESIDLTKSQKQRMKKNLRNEYKFYNYCHLSENEMMKFDKQIQYEKSYKINRLPFILRNSIQKMGKNIEDNSNNNKLSTDNCRYMNTVHFTSTHNFRNNCSHSPIRQLLNNLKCLKDLKIKISKDEYNNINDIKGNNQCKKF